MPAVARAAHQSASYLAALESINAEQLEQYVEHLADDKLQGREAGKPGGTAAGDYLAARLEELALQGGGVDGGFFQGFAPGYRNVLAMVRGSDPKLSRQVILIGAHYDHVGYGTRRSSRGTVGRIHNGADDNASGTSAVLEVAEALTMLAEPPRRSILFAFWDAEEKGMLGSKHWAAHPTVPLKNVVAVINLDMVGSLRQQRLTVFASRSGYGWRRVVCRNNDGLELRLDFPWTVKHNADHYPFFQRSVPAIMFHTGLTSTYHTPGDDAKLLNYAGVNRIARLLFGVVYDLGNEPEVPRFRKAARTETESQRKSIAAITTRLPERLGVSWKADEATDEAVKRDGLRLVRVTAGMPAAAAGIRPGDRIVRLAGRDIRNGEDLRAAVMGAESPATITVGRNDSEQSEELTIRLAGKPLPLGVAWRSDEAEPGMLILTHVVPGSPAGRAALKPGDRIYRLAGRTFADGRQFAETVKTLSGPVELVVERDGQPRTVVLQIESQGPIPAA